MTNYKEILRLHSLGTNHPEKSLRKAWACSAFRLGLVLVQDNGILSAPPLDSIFHSPRLYDTICCWRYFLTPATLRQAAARFDGYVPFVGVLG